MLSAGEPGMTKTPRKSVAISVSGKAEAKKALKARRKAERRTTMTRVSSPTVPGAVENITRVVDPLEVMFKASQLTKRQWRAIESYRNAREVVYGQCGGSMDFDRVRGAGSPGSPPAPAYFDACETLRVAKHKLYALDYRILTMVLGGSHPDDRGANFEECAQRLETLTLDRRKVAERFKIAISVLGDALWGEEKGDKEDSDKGRITGYLAPGARPTESTAESVPQARAVHADGRKIYRTGS